MGASWLETYNNAKAGEMKTVLYDRSWLACRYMGRIMSADTVPEIDTTGMTEDEAFGWMLRWAKGEYIPQVLLDKITHIYAGGDDAVEAFQNEYVYRGNELYININKYDSKFLAWSKFVNNLWEGEQRDTHLNIRPIVLKGISMVESTIGEDEGYNGTINIMQSITIGDGTLWHMANYNPYPQKFISQNRKTGQMEASIMAWMPSISSNGLMIENGFVQFGLGDAFEEDGTRKFKNGIKDYFGKAYVNDEGNPIFREAINTIKTHSTYPRETIDYDKQGPQYNEGEIIMVTYNRQSVDMSLYAACVLLANKGNTERKAVELYNGKDDKDGKGNMKAYADKVEACLSHFFNSKNENPKFIS